MRTKPLSEDFKKVITERAPSTAEVVADMAAASVNTAVTSGEILGCLGGFIILLWGLGLGLYWVVAKIVGWE